MRLTHIASFVLSPMLAVASAVASPVTSDAVVSTPQRVSTGVVAPQILNTLNFRVPAGVVAETPGGVTDVVLSLYVDAQGTPESVRVVKSASPVLDAMVVNAVLHSHFRPAELNHKAIPLQVDLTVNVQR